MRRPLNTYGKAKEDPSHCWVWWRLKWQALMSFMRENHQWPMNSPHKGPVPRKIFQFDDLIISDMLRANPFRKQIQWKDRYHRTSNYSWRHEQTIFSCIDYLRIITRIITAHRCFMMHLCIYYFHENIFKYCISSVPKTDIASNNTINVYHIWPLGFDIMGCQDNKLILFDIFYSFLSQFIELRIPTSSWFDYNSIEFAANLVRYVATN